MAHDRIPATAEDVLLHAKTSDRTERVAFPFTRYRNVICAPNVITDKVEHNGAPFHLLKTGTVELTKEEIIALCGHII
jgi:hypothetical protein